MKFEDLLLEINGFGKFQIMILCINFFCRITIPCHFLLNNFIAAIPTHHCDISALDVSDVFGNLSQEQRLAVSVPVMKNGKWSSCLMFTEPQLQLLTGSSNSTDLPTVACLDGWVYDNSTFVSTLASQWDLVCEKRAMNKAMATIFFVGVMFGAAVFGSLSDRYGRKIMLLVSYISGMGFGLASAFASSLIMFSVLRFFTGFSITGIAIVSTVLNVEWVDVKYRKLVGVIDSLSWTFGIMCLSLIAYCVRDWRWLTVAVTLPITLGIISWRWVPESARWLVATGQLDKAHHYLKQCAIMNQREGAISTITPQTLKSIIVNEEGTRKYSYLDLVRTPKIRRLALFTGIAWLCVATTAYGISFNITGFGLNPYLTQFLYGVVEIPSKFSVYWLLDRFGRRKTEVGSLLLAGVCLMINIFISKDQWIARSTVAVLGRGFCAAAFGTIVLYSSELYPTVIRQNGMGYTSFMARLGVSMAPLILLLEDVWSDLPQVVLCSTALIGAMAARLLPETSNRCLPETIEDIEGTRKELILSEKNDKE
ncbi:solute carrier family 22 member 7-like [Chanos chanos]|uniref:Solute carrier family 22 member 6 n=1 Tax=Chanos chanos TaxID=29144 RepID=A0A6J2WAD7_CHACN|nr:solute carrier family 22 member 7-like [Chanos chanos]